MGSAWSWGAEWPSSTWGIASFSSTPDAARSLYAVLSILAAGVLHRIFLIWRRSGIQRARFAQFARRSYGLPDLAQMPRGAAAACAEMWVTFDSLRARGVCKAAPVVTTPKAKGEMPRRNRSYSALAALAEDEPLDATEPDEMLAAVGQSVYPRPQLPVLQAPRRMTTSTDDSRSPGGRIRDETSPIARVPA
eukprot:scaffold45670_cov36-Tisochrysis_lutea.AAC.3